MIKTFSELNLIDDISLSLKDMGFSEPTAVQAEVIPFILEGKDCLAQAPTGTGKTCAFGIPFLNKIDVSNNAVQALIICPTRELAMQIEKELKKVAANIRGAKIVAVYGGQNIERQLASLRKKPQIVVGTPGRLMDHLRRRTIKLDEIQMLALDEADEMLNMGFREDIDEILTTCNSEHQTVLFSATMSKEILDISKNYQKDPVSVKVQLSNNDLPQIEQYYLKIKDKEKTQTLIALIEEKNYELAIIFCNTKKRVDELNEALNDAGFRAEALHGDMRQRNRDQVMKRYRGGDLNFLVATDVAARGIDVDGIEAVFNYDVPMDEEYYVHRIGRTARAKRTGVAFSFVTDKDAYKIRDFERYTKNKLKNLGDELENMASFSMDKKMQEALKEINGDLEEYKGVIVNEIEKYNESSKKPCSFLDFAAAILKTSTYAIKPQVLKAEGSSERGGRRTKNPNSVRFFLNVGKKDRLNDKEFKNMFFENTTLKEKDIDDVSLLETFSFLETDKSFTEEVLALSGMNINGRTLKVELAGERPSGDRKSSSRSGFGGRSGGFSREKSFGGERKERSFGGERKERSFGGERKERSFGGEKKESSFGGERKERSFKSDDKKSFGAKSTGKSFGSKSKDSGFKAGKKDSFSSRSKKSF